MKVLFEDNQIIVVEKPFNIPSQGDKTGDVDMLSMVKDYVKEKYNKPGNVYIGLVHRLDRPTGGVMVFARTSKAAGRLSDEIRERKIQKSYLAICNGKFDETKGTMKDYLWKDEKKNTSYVVKASKKNAKEAILDYEVLKYDEKEDVSLVKINLHTGRHHQIRVQFSSRMHALYGDTKYHGKGGNAQLCLWAYKLSLIHPTTKEELTYIDLPESKGIWKLIEGLNID
jgi:23S rRNA pseudouridine1911/1915/1917 synthase